MVNQSIINHVINKLLLVVIAIGICFSSYGNDNIRFKKLGFNEGLSQNSGNDIFYDSYGYIWIATEVGVNRYDGYEIKNYMHDPNDIYSMPGYVITSILEDSNGNLWFASRESGVSYFDRMQEKFTQIEFINKSKQRLKNIAVTSLMSGPSDFIWIGTQIHGLFRININSIEAELIQYQSNDEAPNGNKEIYTLHVDNVQRLWIGGSNDVDIISLRNAAGSLKYESATAPILTNAKVLSFAEETNGAIWIGTENGLNYYFDGEIRRHYDHSEITINGLSDSMIQSLFIDNDNDLWIGTNSGLHLYDRRTDTFIAYQNNNADANSISAGIVYAITEDNSKNIWIGIRGGGVNYFNKRLKVFSHYRQQADKNSIDGISVFSIYEDKDKMIWIGTEGGGLNLLDPITDVVKHYKHNPQDKNSLSENYVGTIYQDYVGYLWLGTYFNGLDKLNLEKNEFNNIKISKDGLHSLNTNRITAIVAAEDNTYWLSTYHNGLIRINFTNGEYQYYQHDPANPSSISSNSIRTMRYTKNGMIWLGTEVNGISVFNPATEEFTHYRHDDDNTNSLAHDSVISLYEDSKGDIWVGTTLGIDKFDNENGSITHYTKDQGLADNVIYAILEDKSHNIWVSTNIGLSRLNPINGEITNYYEQDGLQSNEFNAEAAAISHDGRLYFGGINGVTAFYPEQLKRDINIPNIMITGFLIDNKDVALKSKKSTISAQSFYLDQGIDMISSLILSHKESNFTFEFSALSFYDSKRNQYAYKLQGWDKYWITTDYKVRRATYTNIPAGEYIFKVKASNSDGVWNAVGTQIQLTILPPPWLTWWAYTLYALLCSYVLYYVVRLQQKKIIQKQLELEKEQEISKQLKKVDRLKDEFLANTSHELRTPLNGIIGLTESLIDGITGNLNEQTKKNLSMIVNSSRRLSNLVNDILDFSKMRNKKIELQFSSIDLKAIVDTVVALSVHLVNDKSIAILNLIPEDFPLLEADGNRLQQIFYNLLGNSIKFTQKGQINITAKLLDNKAKISITDPGIGISKDQLDNIFVSFEQGIGDSTREFSGTGLGLAVTRQLVELHGGNITVESILGKGSTFNFTLDISADQSKSRGLKVESGITQLVDLSNDKESDTTLPIIDELSGKIEELISNVEKKYKILIVDDEEINRQVLINHLSMFNYELREADCGLKALNLINEEKDFDIILLDIMMPKLSGYQVCTSIREQYGVNELPVIFLTAKNQVSDLVESFAAGANDYLSKPVAKYELISRLTTHLQLLDIHRNLENKIAERTQELVNTNQELETLNSIIITINKAIDLELLLNVLITEGVGLFPQASTGCYLHKQEDGKHFEVTASYGFKKNKNIVLISAADVNFHYIVYSDEIENNVYIVKPTSKHMPISDLPTPKVMLVMRIDFEEELSGILILNNYSNTAAFDKSDLRKLSHFYEHVKTAITKALLLQRSNRLLETIKEKNSEILEAQNQLIMQEKMVTLGNLTDGVAHEINNPVNFVHVSLDNLSHDLTDFREFLFSIASDDADNTVLDKLQEHFCVLEEHVNIIKNGSRRIRYIVECLRGLTKPDSIVLCTLNIHSSITSILHLIKIKYENIADFENNCHIKSEINCYASQINQVFMSLITNACEAIKRNSKNNAIKGKIKISSYTKDKYLIVEISDTGCGMDEDIQDKIFEPFFTTKDIGEGTGLGLSMAQTAIKNHDGEIEFVSSVGHGSRFTLRFPDNAR